VSLRVFPGAGISGAPDWSTGNSSDDNGDVTTAVSKYPGDPYQTSDGWCHFTNWDGNPSYGLPARSSGWSITVACMGLDNHWWHNIRATSGSWSGWDPGKGF
jgi:hypothetical protein